MKTVQRISGWLGLALLAATGVLAPIMLAVPTALTALATTVGIRTSAAADYPRPRKLTTDLYVNLVMLPLAGLLATWLTVAGTLMLPTPSLERLGWALLALGVALPVEILVLIALNARNAVSSPFDTDEVPAVAITALGRMRRRERPLTFTSRRRWAARWSVSQSLAEDCAPAGDLAPTYRQALSALKRMTTGEWWAVAALLALNGASSAATSYRLLSIDRAPAAVIGLTIAVLLAATGVAAYAVSIRADARQLLRVRSRTAHLRAVANDAVSPTPDAAADGDAVADWRDLMERAVRAFQTSDESGAVG